MEKIILGNKQGYKKEYNLMLQKGQIEPVFLKQASKEQVKKYLQCLAPIQQEVFKAHYGLEKEPEDLKSIAKKLEMPLEQIVKAMDMGLAVFED